ncbi:MAG: RNA ligase (ATP) [Clostridiales bacterium]|nr:RNA ligase (ATP) [Clostridiales bacterium]
MRSLATIQEIGEISPIENADSIEMAKILGWQCVVKKGEFQPGQKIVYFEVDSFLPEEERYEFLRGSSFRDNADNGRGFRIRTLKFRGQISQGLVQSLDVMPEVDPESPIGTDLTELLHVKKWFINEIPTGSGRIIGDRPAGVPMSDEVRIQSEPDRLQLIAGLPYYITTKIDGSACYNFFIDGRFGVSSRNHEIGKEEEASLYWLPDEKYGIEAKLKKLGKNLSIQGEICGSGIQANPLRIDGVDYYVYDVRDISAERYYNLDELKEFCSSMQLKMVPIEEEGPAFGYSQEELLFKAQGKYPNGGKDKEGIVVRSTGVNCQRVSFKVLNNAALAKEK